MPKKSRIFFFSFLLLNLSLLAQTHLTPGFLRAIENETRTREGLPGKNYFQNHSDYQMDVNFSPRSGKLEGTAKIMYYNTSTDTLRRLVFRLYHNILKQGGVRDEEIDHTAIENGVIISGLKVNGIDFTEKLSRLLRFESTNMYLTLREPLIPFSSTQIEISWQTKVPSLDVHRFGGYGEGNFFVAFWYPQIAVYDDLDGWDELIYNGTQEFYNDFNSYDVRINVPASFVVWATGQWLNSEEILSKKCQDNLKRASESDEVISIITKRDLEKKSWRSNGKRKTYHFRIDSVPDFAFAVSDRYVWDATSVVVDTLKNRRVIIHAAYPEGAKYFDHVAEIGAKVIRDFGYRSYGIPYPYASATIFNGEGGMEFPMIVNNGDRFFYNGTVFLTMHELAHAYFPFLTGINERKYAWMDEGLTTFLPMETESAMGSDEYPISRVVRSYDLMAGSDYDIPMGISSYYTRSDAYYYHAYIRSSVAFHMLEEYVGRDTFRLAIQDFITIWKHKHPTPYDLFAIIKNRSNKDTDWFIDQWFFQQGWPDLAIEGVLQLNDTIQVDLVKKGKFAVPIEMQLEFEDSDSELIEFSPDVWRGQDQFSISYISEKKLIGIKLNVNNIPDIDRSNNYYVIPSN